MLENWKIKWQSGNKFLMKNSKTGEERKVERDVEGIKRGDYLQGVGSDKDSFLKKYGYLPNVPKEETDKYLNQHK